MSPRARRNPLEGGAGPRARRNPLEGAFNWATPVGRGDHRSVGRALCVRLSKRCVSLCFLQVLSRTPRVFRGPSGLSRTLSILVNSRQRTKAKDNEGKLTQQALLVLQGHAKPCPQTGMRREDYDALNPTDPN
jgi:hypothetical protein